MTAPLHSFVRADGTEAQASYSLAPDGSATIHGILASDGQDLDLSGDERECLVLDVEAMAALGSMGD